MELRPVLAMLRLAGSWFKENPQKSCTDLAAMAIEVAIILTCDGIWRGIADGPTHARILFGAWAAGLFLLIALTGFLLLAISGYFSALEKTRELGVLRVHGASSGLIAILFLSEGLLIALLATSLGVVLTYSAKLGAALYFPKLLRIQIVCGWWPIAGGLAVTASFLGTMIGARKAIREGVVQTLFD
jgi:hypothetical protein